MLKKYMKIVKILLVVLFTILLIIGIWQINKFWRNYLNSDFTTKEYDEIISRGKAGKDGLLPIQSEFIKNNIEFKRKVSLLPKERQRMVVNAIIKISVSEQRKLEAPTNGEVMAKFSQDSGMFVECLSDIEFEIYKYYLSRTESTIRRIAILKADSLYSFKLHALPSPSRKECFDYLNSGN